MAGTPYLQPGADGFLPPAADGSQPDLPPTAPPELSGGKSGKAAGKAGTAGKVKKAGQPPPAGSAAAAAAADPDLFANLDPAAMQPLEAYTAAAVAASYSTTAAAAAVAEVGSAVDLDSATDSNHDTALTLACAGGHEELVTLLLNRGADIGMIHPVNVVIGMNVTQYIDLSFRTP